MKQAAAAKSSRRLVAKEGTSSRVLRAQSRKAVVSQPEVVDHAEADKRKVAEDVARVGAVGDALQKAFDLTVTGEFKRREEVKQLSRDTAEELVSQMLQQTDLPTDSDDELGVEGTVGKVRFAYLEDAEEELSEEEKVEEEELGEGEEKEGGEAEEAKVAKDPSTRKSLVPEKDPLLQRVEELKDQDLVLRITNLLLQRKIAQITVSRKDMTPVHDPIRHQRRLRKPESPDPKKRYREALEQYGRLKDDLAAEKQRCEEDLTARRAYRRSLEEQLGAERRGLLLGIQRCAETLPMRRKGAPMDKEEREELLQAVDRKFGALRQEHARFVWTARKLRAVQAKVKTLELFGERKQMADFEQLVEENQKIKERVEERDDMIRVLRERAYNELQEMAHMKDMIEGTEEDIDALVKKLGAVDDKLEWSRDAVAKAKRRRDYIRRWTKKVVEELDLLAYPHLLQHFQDLRRATEEAQETLSALVRAHLRQEEKIVAVRRKLLKLSHILNEKLPGEVMEELNKRSSLSRIAERAVTEAGMDHDEEVLLQRRSLVSLSSVERFFSP